MKILQVIDLLSPAHGGSAKVAYHVSKELARRGHGVTIYTSSSKLTQAYLKSISEVRVYPFKTWSGLAEFQITPGMVRQAKEEIKHFDVIHLHNYRTFQNIVVHHYAQKYGIPYVLQAHGSLTTFFQKGWLKKVFDVLWGYQILKDASRIMAVTEIEAQQYGSMGTGKDKIEIVPHGVDLSEFANLPQRGEFRSKYGLAHEQKIVLYLGRIHKIKGLDLLVKAFADLAKLEADVKLVITGPDDGYLSFLKKLVAERGITDKVLFTGPLYGEDKLQAYVDADVYVLPSSYEIFGMTILEALGCGIPVIVTDRCGLADEINGQAGLVVAYDKDQLRSALFNILSDEKARLELGKKGKALVREKFNGEKIVEQIERMYQGVLSIKAKSIS